MTDERAIEAALNEMLLGYPEAVSLEKSPEGGLRSVIDRDRVRKRLRAAIAAYEAALWTPVSEHDGSFDPIILELDDGTCGEARWYEGERDWYWAGTTPESYHAGPVSDINIAKPRRFRPLPTPPEEA